MVSPFFHIKYYGKILGGSPLLEKLQVDVIFLQIVGYLHCVPKTSFLNNSIKNGLILIIFIYCISKKFNVCNYELVHHNLFCHQ